jgi:uncharacterized protein YdhG (YjbR/CyaY superfamily)
MPIRRKPTSARRRRRLGASTSGRGACAGRRSLLQYARAGQAPHWRGDAADPEGSATVAGKPETVDAYLAALPGDRRAALEQLRRTISAAVPQAEERISYGLPAFRVDGRMLVGFGATANHCALYLMSSSTVQAHTDELQGYDTSKGTIRFQPQQPPPADLVRKLVRARIEENARS